MLDEYLRRGDVSSFIDDILFNERYFQKKKKKKKKEMENKWIKKSFYRHYLH